MAERWVGFEGRPSWWCRFGLHHWFLGVDKGGAIVSMCGDCGLMEIVREES